MQFIEKKPMILRISIDDREFRLDYLPLLIVNIFDLVENIDEMSGQVTDEPVFIVALAL